MASVAIPIRLERAINMKSYLAHRCPPQPPSHFTSDVPQPQTSLVTAPLINPDIYVGLQLVDDSGITFRWGAAHKLDHIQIGLGRHSSLRPWPELTPFEQSIALEWARDVIFEHHVSDWPLIRFAGWWALSTSYHASGEDMLPESALMTREWKDRGLALTLAESIFSWVPPTSFLETETCTGSAPVSGSVGVMHTCTMACLVIEY